MLNQKNRISNRHLIDKLNKEGKAYKTSHFVFKFLPSVSDDSKFAAVVSKKVATKAVKRNRLRRQITESLRLNLDTLKKPIVCLVILKKGSPDELEYSLIESHIKEFFNQLSDNV
ncbi:ribonuclease P protein component [Patescibacteria group bacterium]|nr:ribonuclease P protein component [Patescibacteria group bacterium]MBU1016150.1 ribonuclease P protein component [Patescibacteria group bacterium]MBU1938331.1 ribonuclease P protein component [Patescibacteria group bacterium]